MLWLLFFPVLLPFYLLRAVLRLVTALLVLPIVFLVALIGLLAGGFALSLVVLAPLVPFLLLLALVLGVLKLVAGPARSAV